ncbi:hypothetical protein SEA_PHRAPPUCCINO_54 [Mycobacterium phage Phrappuccino]|uniref:Uncharacterized protein n=1 Tax=Mycobacterium phage Phrappuccino TaxID=2591223 RepID=A0A514DDN8_9CAUD|nr:hypothetical protein KHQ87_gp054 [Mycobacterium phage Phrappuccino]QDH91729.1 hypothetical protein SEA_PHRAPPUCCINO_54 [Mycobacterium phage Phrappuccino]QIQ63172.1 hypothetical protein SEA_SETTECANDELA_54 [Mycobacterium phage Settecandela]
MFRVTPANPAQKRTIRPVYAQHQATAYAGFLDPAWDRSFDIVPGTVMSRKSGEVFEPFTGKPGQKPFGLSALFAAPRLGIDEVTGTGANNFTVWVGGEQAVFEILNPGFDLDADWNAANVTDGSFKLLTATDTGLLTPTGVDHGNAVAELIDVISTDAIQIRLNRYDLTSAVALAGGS